MTAKKHNRWRRLLRKAANVLKTHGWNRVLKAKNSCGHHVDPLDPDANSFCLVGALLRANGKRVESYYHGTVNNYTPSDLKENKTYYEAITNLRARTKIGLWEFNDKFGTTKEDVIKVLLETANG